MVNKPKNIGTAFESATREYLKTWEYEGAYRPALSGKDDVGDVHPYSQPKWIIECKAGKAAETASAEQINKWTVEAYDESINAGCKFEWILVLKTAGIGISRMSDQRAYIQLRSAQTGAHYVVRMSLHNAVKEMLLRHDDNQEEDSV